MKNKIQLAICIAIVMLCLSNLTIAQPIIQNGTSQNLYGETNSTPVSQNDWIRRLGVGAFSINSDEPHSFLQVNSNYLLLPANGSITNKGQLLRTDGPSGVDHQWRMFSDNSSTNTEKFNITNPSGTKDIKLGTVASGDLYMFTNGTTNSRVTIKSGGNIGIGTTTPSTSLSFDGNSARTIQMERHTTAASAGNNLTILAGGAKSAGTNLTGGELILSSGIATGTGDSKIELQTASPGVTGTGDRPPTLKMVVLGNGNVGIGTTIPCSLLDVKGTITATQIIIEKDNTKQDLLALIEQLQQRVAALEQQLTAFIKN